MPYEPRFLKRFEPIEPPEDQPGLGSDIAYGITSAANKGLAGLGRSINTVVGDGIDGEIIKQLDANAAYGQEQLSDRQKEANAKKFITDDNRMGDAWTDPRAYSNVAASAVGSQIPMLITGGPLAGAVKKGLTLAGTKGLAQKVAGATAFGAAETAMVTGAVSGDIQEGINNMPEEVIVQSPAFQDKYWNKIDAGVDDDIARREARAELGRELGVQGMKDVAPITFALGSVAGSFLDKFVSGKLAGSRLQNAAVGATTEGLTEAGQGAAEHYTTQDQLSQVDKSIDPIKGMANAALMEGLGGGMFGGVVGGLSRPGKKDAAPTSEEEKTLDNQWQNPEFNDRKYADERRPTWTEPGYQKIPDEPVDSNNEEQSVESAIEQGAENNEFKNTQLADQLRGALNDKREETDLGQSGELVDNKADLTRVESEQKTIEPRDFKQDGIQVDGQESGNRRAFDETAPKDEQENNQAAQETQTEAPAKKDPILTQPKNKYIANQLKQQQIKPKSPGFKQAKARIQNQYEVDLERAQFSLPFDEFKQLKDNEGQPEELLRQSYDVVRDDLGIKDDLSVNAAVGLLQDNEKTKPALPDISADTALNEPADNSGETIQAASDSYIPQSTKEMDDGRGGLIKEPPKGLYGKGKVKDTDELLTAVKKLGGIKRKSHADRAGFSDYRGRKFQALFNNGANSKTFDEMAELLREHGFDTNGENDLIDKVSNSLSGNEFFTPAGFERVAKIQVEEHLKDEEARFVANLEELIASAQGLDLYPGLEDSIKNGRVSTTDDIDAWREDIEDEINDRRSKEAGADSVKEDEGDFLTGYTGQDLKQREQKKADEERKQAEADRKAEIDKNVDDVVDSFMGDEKGKTSDVFGHTSGLEKPGASTRTNKSTKVGQPQFDIFRQNETLSKAIKRKSEPKASAGRQESDRVRSTVVANVKTSEVKTGITKVETPEDALHVIAPIQDNAQEVMVALVLDKDNNILQLVKHSKGLADSTQADTDHLVGSIMDIPGAKSVYYAHNHPTGLVRQSKADLNITQRLYEVARGTNLKTNGMLVTGVDGDGSLYDGATEREIKASTHKRTLPIPVTERIFKKRGGLPDIKIDSPSVAKTVAKSVSNGETGIILLDNKHSPMSFISMSLSDMRRLKTGDNDSGVGMLLREIHATNSRALIINISKKDATGSKAAVKNVTSFVNSLGNTRILDAFVDGKSMSKDGYNFKHGGAFYSKSTEDSDNFTKWSNGNEVIESDKINDHDFSDGKGVVLKVFHGTTHEFNEFNADRGSKESQFGAVNYFTSSEYDAEQNYAGEGPDLTRRIALRAERITDEITELSLDDIRELSKKHNIDFDENIKSYPEALPLLMAREELSGGNENILEVYVKIDKPFVIGEGDAWIEFVDTEAIEKEAIEKVAEDNNISELDLDKFQDEINDARYESKDNYENALREAIDTVADRYELNASELMADVYDNEYTTTALEELMRSDENISYAEDPETGGLIQTQIIAEIIQELGFDGIILKNAESRFSAMDMEQGTSHVHVFHEDRTNIKSVYNSGEYSPSNPNIYKSKSKAKSNSTVQQVISWLPGRAQKMVGNGLEVVQSVKDLPVHLQEIGADLYSSESISNIEGLYDPATKETYLIADMLTKDNVNQVLNHELLHKRLAEDTKLREQLNSTRSGLRDIFDKIQSGKYQGRYKKLYDEAIKRVDAADTPDTDRFNEFLAYSVTEFSTKPHSLPSKLKQLIQKLIASVKTALMKYGVMVNKLTPADLNALAMQAMDKKVDKDSDSGNLLAEPKLSRASDSIDSINRWFNGAPLSESVGSNLGMADESRVEMLTRLFQDGFNRAKTLQETIKARGGIVNELNDVYLAEERSSGITAARLDDLTNDHVTPLIDAIADNDLTLQQIDDYVMAKHAGERNEYIASIDGMQDGGSGLTNKQAEEKLAEFEQQGLTEKLESVASLVYDMNSKTLDTLIHDGLIDAKTYHTLKNQYKYYVPLKGKDGVDERGGGGQGYSIRSSGLKAAMGRGEGNVAESPLAHSVAQAESAIIRAEKNRIGQTLMRLMKDNPDPDFWTVTEADYNKFIDLDGALFEGFDELPKGLIENQDVHRVMAYTAKELKQAKEEGRKPKKKVVYKVDPAYKYRKDVFSVMAEGKMHQVTLKDEVLAEQLKKLNANELNHVLKNMGTLNRFLAMINTALNPEFVITNLQRDLQAAGINLAGEHSAGMAKQVMMDVPAAAKGIFKYMFKREGYKDDEWSKLYNELQHEGGTIGFFGLEDIDTKVKNIEKKLTVDDSYLGKTKKGLTAIKEAIMDANASVENAARLAAYKAAKDKGMSKKQSASLAKNLTVNFNRRGEYAPVINSAYLFANASIQGTARLFTALKYPAVRKIIGGVASTSFALAAYNMAAGGEDDDGISKWEKVSDYLKQTNLIIMHPDGSGNYFKWKMPYGYNVFWYTGTALHDLMFGEKTTSLGQSGKILSTAMNAFNPIQGADFLDTLTPTALKPIEQDVRNINFMMTPIRPDNPFDRYDRPESDKAFFHTSSALKDLSKFLNEATGGNDTKAGIIDISPETIKHYMGWLTGGAGMTVYRSLEGAGKLAAGESVQARQIPFIRAFGGNVGTHFDAENFYSSIEDVAARKEQHKRYKQAGDLAEARDYFKENRRTIALSKLVNGYKKRLKVLRARKRLAARSGHHDRANAIKEDMAMVMRQFIKKYQAAN